MALNVPRLQGLNNNSKADIRFIGAHLKNMNTKEKTLCSSCDAQGLLGFSGAIRVLRTCRLARDGPRSTLVKAVRLAARDYISRAEAHEKVICKAAGDKARKKAPGQETPRRCACNAKSSSEDLPLRRRFRRATSAARSVAGAGSQPDRPPPASVQLREPVSPPR